MSPKIIITTPFPTSEEVAAYYRIPAKRVAELRQMMDDIRADEAKKDSRKSGRATVTRKASARRKTPSSKR